MPRLRLIRARGKTGRSIHRLGRGHPESSHRLPSPAPDAASPTARVILDHNVTCPSRSGSSRRIRLCPQRGQLCRTRAETVGIYPHPSHDEHMTADGLRDALEQRILVLDGAMGTMLQGAGLTAEDFGGAALEGCNENLNLTRPDVIRRVHAAYLGAGADVISTNTFGCAPWVLGEYGLAERAYEITRAAARLAREVAGDALVVGALGPSTRSISVTRNITFDEVREGYALQAAALIDGGVDAILLETSQDTLNVKAAGLGVRRALREAGSTAPLMLSATIEPMGTMLAGQAVEAFAASVEHLGP